MRCTPERYAILSAVEGLVGRFGVEDIIERLSQSNYHVAMATVHYTLNLLTDCGIVRRFVVERGRYSYELAEPGQSGGRHVHLVCNVCGKIKSVRDAELARSIAARSWTGFSPADYTLTITGVCSACRRKNHSPKRK